MHDNLRIRDWLFTACMLLCSLVTCAPLYAEPGIAVLMSSDSAPYQTMLEGFQAHLRNNGIQADYEVLYTTDADSNAQQLSARVEQQDAALVYCLGTQACQTAQQAAHPRPLVASLVLTQESIATGVPATGVYLNYLPETQLQWLKRLFPKFRRVGVIYNPEQNQALVDRATRAAQQHGLELVATAVDTPKELPAALENLLRDIDILWALPDRLVLAPQSAREVLLTTFRNRIPVIGSSAPWVKGGALYALDWDYADIGAQNAAMALKIINGMPISKIPITEPRSVAYTLNLKTAQHMKLDIPTELTRGAKHVYQ